MDMINRFLTTSARYLELELNDNVHSLGVSHAVSEEQVASTIDSCQITNGMDPFLFKVARH
jgi:hypothetical protein